MAETYYVGDQAAALASKIVGLAEHGDLDPKTVGGWIMHELLDAQEAARAESDEGSLRRRSTREHAFHVWINQRQEARRLAGESWESSLYEWKAAMMEIRRLPGWLKRARNGELPSVHRQCSHSAPTEIAQNRLVCALGQDVTACPILRSLYEHFKATGEHERNRDARWVAEHPERPRVRDEDSYVDESDADLVGGTVCAWHIFSTVFSVGEHRTGHDTSEGYVQDESDRMFWHNVYDSLSRHDEAPE